MDSTTLFVGLVAGAIGMGYFVYGKKQQRIVPLLCGVGLSVYPYFVDGLWLLIAIGVVLAALPFVVRR